MSQPSLQPDARHVRTAFQELSLACRRQLAARFDRAADDGAERPVPTARSSPP